MMAVRELPPVLTGAGVEGSGLSTGLGVGAGVGAGVEAITGSGSGVGAGMGGGVAAMARPGERMVAFGSPWNAGAAGAIASNSRLIC